MSYTPNISDKRVHARITKALGWAQSTLSSCKEKPVPQSVITKYLGQQQDNLARWLKKRLLTVSDNHYNMETGQCKKYVLNGDGCDEIKQLLGITKKQITTEWVDKEFSEEVSTGNFTYTDKSSRLWHPLQSVKSEIRDAFLAKNEVKHNYDIECAAPTLIYQNALRYGLTKPCPTIKAYTDDRRKIRNQLASSTGISTDTIKTVINGLFSGAQVGLNKKSKLYAEVGGHDKMVLLKDHSIIKKLKKEVKYCWDAIRSQLNTTGKLNAKVKSAHYRSLEREVLDSVIQYLKMSDAKYITIHDGWVTDEEIDINLLENYITQMTGYVVRIEYESL